jgi:hypothetical protein|tara:strand:- start:301 stop:801 length:501 start_codon:yes stop_codon:yes gene_type:complete
MGQALGFPVLSKDDIKETLMDNLAWTDRASSMALGKAAIDLLFRWIAVEIAAKRSLIAEMNFHAHLDPPKFVALRKRMPCRFVQVHCTAPKDVLIERYQTRAASGARHPGHFDDATEVQGSIVERLDQGEWAPLQIAGPLIHGDPAVWDFDRILSELRTAIDRPED